MSDELNYQGSSETPENEKSLFNNISLEQVRICLQEGIDLNNLYLLEAFAEGTDLTKHLDSSKFETWKQNLIRKSLIDEQGYITLKGQDVLDRIRKSIDKKTVKYTRNIKPGEESAFERWWKAYPATDNFEISGKKFTGIRSFKKEKTECMLMFNRIIQNGRITEEEMIGALNLDVENRKRESVRSGENKLKYLQNTATYLRQFTYEPYVELYKKSKESGHVNPPDKPDNNTVYI